MDEKLKYCSRAEEAEQRRWEFVDGFGSDGFFETGLIKCIENTARICSVFFGSDAADTAFNQMIGQHLPDVVKTQGWLGALKEEFNGLYSELPVGVLFHDLEAYANFGLLTGSYRDEIQRREALERMISQAQNFLELIPLVMWGLKAEHLTMIAQKALVRWKLDNGESVKAKELALISSRAHQTIKNNVGRKGKPIVGNESHIEASEALAWLGSLKDFKDSIWRHQDDVEYLDAIHEPLSEAVFVPETADGSIFNPNHRKDGFYLVGPEGDEEKIKTFEEALERLQLMPTPFWRRPTEGGVWTRVRGVGWKRVTRVELCALGPGTHEGELVD